MSESREYRSWTGTTPADPRAVSAQDRREARRRWLRPASAGVAAVAIAVDAVLLLVVAALRSYHRNQVGRPCPTFWKDLAHDTTANLVIVLIFLAVTIVASVWRRWVFVSVLVVQLAFAAVLIPTTLHSRSQFLAVADGRLLPTAVDTGGVACDA